MRAFFRHLRGIAVFSGFVINTLLCFLPLLILAIIKLLMPIPVIRRGITRVLMRIGEAWVDINSAILAGAGSIPRASSAYAATNGLNTEPGGWKSGRRRVRLKRSSQAPM